MKLTLHVSPTRTSYAVGHGEISARVAEESDEIASFLADAGAVVQVLEEPATPSTDSDFSLVFARDLQWHLESGERTTDRLVVLHADRVEILEIVEAHRVAAAVFYMQAAAFTKDNRGLVVRRDVAARLGGELGPGGPYFKASEHYASWQNSAHSSLAAKLVVYLEAYLQHTAPSSAPVLVAASDATQRGLPPLTIRYDQKVGGMSPRLFPTKDIYLILDSPPGAPISIVVWNITGLPDDDEQTIRTKYVPPWASEIELGATEPGVLLGTTQTGMTFATDRGRERCCWFAVRVQRGETKVLVALSVGGRNGSSFTAADVLDNSLIHSALTSLRIE